VGENQPNLNNNQYDFPDDLIEPFAEQLLKLIIE
jgi:hypothetical protein